MLCTMGINQSISQFLAPQLIQLGILEIPKSFEVPSSYVGEVEAFEVLAEFLDEMVC